MSILSNYNKALKTLIYAQKFTWKSAIYYRLQSVLWLASSVFSAIIAIVFVSVIYGLSSGFPGWSYYQVLTLI